VFCIKNELIQKAPRELTSTFPGASGQYLHYREWTVIAIFFHMEVRAADCVCSPPSASEWLPSPAEVKCCFLGPVVLNAVSGRGDLKL